MELHANLTVTELGDPSDFRSLKAVATKTSHIWVTREEITKLAGERATDPSWRQGLDEMFDYARAHGWVNDDGAVRAHVEWS